MYLSIGKRWVWPWGNNGIFAKFLFIFVVKLFSICLILRKPLGPLTKCDDGLLNLKTRLLTTLRTRIELNLNQRWGCRLGHSQSRENNGFNDAWMPIYTNSKNDVSTFLKVWWWFLIEGDKFFLITPQSRCATIYINSKLNSATVPQNMMVKIYCSNKRILVNASFLVEYLLRENETKD